MIPQEPVLQLEMIPTDYVRVVWPMVVDRMKALASEYGDGWIAEDVFVDLVAGGAYLWGTENLEGFVVLTILTAPWGKDLNVWIADNETLQRAAVYWEQLKQIARDNGCQRVVFESEREGFTKAIPSLEVRYRYFEIV
jgi:hypothetical protein